jgi:hypothetical protein
MSIRLMGVCCDLSLILETRLNKLRQTNILEWTEERRHGGGADVIALQLTKRIQDCDFSLHSLFHTERTERVRYVCE